ncbi:MAG: hypothetical protein Q4A83_04800 [Bacillota bacterium]|nr:hypothetical protein [Bacillota bacterium]
MKRFIVSLLVLMMCLSLCACAQSTEKMLEEAIELNWQNVHDEYLENAARAAEEYDGKIVKWTATVYDIGIDNVSMAESAYMGAPLNAITVHFNEDEDGISNLSDGDVITIVGTMHMGPFGEIDNAYIVSD